ncbi:exonuclease domain-containing protein, partial [Pseudomonas sp. SIMBA_059]
AEKERKAAGRETTQKTVPDDEALAGYLESTGNYRILRRLQPRAVIERPRPGFPRRGVILDTETTGLDHRTDEIIEIGVIAFTFD